MPFSLMAEYTYTSGDNGDAPDVLVNVNIYSAASPGPGDKHRKAGPAQAPGFIRPVM